MDRSRPDIGHRGGAVGTPEVEILQLLRGALADPLAPLPYFIRETLTVLWDVLQDNLIQEHGYGVQVAGESLSTNPERFKWNGPSACEWIDDQRPSARHAAE